jgi:hypothetical protein
MFVTKRFTRGAAAASLAGILLASTLAGCGSDADSAEGTATATPASPGTETTPQAEAPHAPAQVGPNSNLPPNELGQIMVLEYHRLGEPENDYHRSAAHFRSDLESLYNGGYRPITMRQMVEGDIDLPAGLTPVVFTFDDSSQGQFYLREDGTVDPNTMMGMWDAFKADHPGWDGGATWCVLPAAEYPSTFFSERPAKEVPRAERDDRIRKKIDHLLSNGHEICNHTLYHARLDRARDDAQVQEWIGWGEDSVKVFLPADYDIVTLALPLGQWPKNRELAWKGSYKGHPYEFKAILEVTGGPAKSPFDVEFDPHSIPRVVMAPGFLERNLANYEKNPERRFVSDGDAKTIAVPAANADRVAKAKWPALEVKVAAAAGTG